MAVRYLGTALGGMLRQEFTAEEFAEIWESVDSDLREDDPDTGVITLWARSTDGSFRLAPVYFRRLEGQTG